MEYDKVKQLIEDMGNSKLTSLDIDFPDGTKISMKKEEHTLPYVKTEEVSTDEEKNVEKQEKIDEIPEGNIVKSPMVGTFYAKSSPNSEPYVEAMKLMNEIESEFEGVIKEILVKDGEPVEYGKPLFVIK